MAQLTAASEKAIVFHNQAMTDAESQAGALATGFGGKKRIKEPIHNIMLDAGSLIGDRQADILFMALSNLLSINENAFVRIGIGIAFIQGITGIAHDIEDYLLIC